MKLFRVVSSNLKVSLHFFGGLKPNVLLCNFILTHAAITFKEYCSKNKVAEEWSRCTLKDIGGPPEILLDDPTFGKQKLDEDWNRKAWKKLALAPYFRDTFLTVQRLGLFNEKWLTWYGDTITVTSLVKKNKDTCKFLHIFVPLA